MSSKYPQKFKNAEAKRRDIQLIHIAKQQLGLDEETYRAMLMSVGGKSSSSELDIKGRKAVLDHLKACGFKPTRAQRPGQTHRALAAEKQPIEAKIGAQLKALGAEWPYAYAIARRLYPEVTRFEFLTVEQLGKVSGALARTINSRKG